ncbi:MAG: hypothetical protein WC300_03080 [Candidatus Omnitrophota bacterium]
MHKKVPTLGKDGKSRYLLGISDDTTEYERAYAEIARLRKARYTLAKSESRCKSPF